MDDDLRTEIVEFLDENKELDLDEAVELLEVHLNEIGYAFYDERGPVPLKL